MTIPMQGNPSRYPYPIDPLALAVMGIFFSDPYGSIRIHDGWATIGTVVVTARGVMVAPRWGATSDGLLRELVAAATRTWLEGPPSVDRGWTRLPGGNWMSAMQVRYPDSGDWSPVENRRAISAITSGSVSGTRLTCSGSSVPSGR